MRAQTGQDGARGRAFLKEKGSPLLQRVRWARCEGVDGVGGGGQRKSERERRE